MSNAVIYPVQLLNDIHNWFPEILYNPQRFQTVQDLIQYIGQVARMNSYEQGQSRYHAQQRRAQQHAQPAVQPPIRPVLRPIHLSDPIIDTIQLRVPSASQVSHASPTSISLLSNLVNQVLQGDISPLELGYHQRANLSSSLMQTFLNDTVVVRPTLEQINNSTTIFMAATNLDDNCAICQDPLEQGNELCVINHCGHTFHKGCITPWFQQNTRCPTCRHDIRE